MDGVTGFADGFCTGFATGFAVALPRTCIGLGTLVVQGHVAGAVVLSLSAAS